VVGASEVREHAVACAGRRLLADVRRGMDGRSSRSRRTGACLVWQPRAGQPIKAFDIIRPKAIGGSGQTASRCGLIRRTPHTRNEPHAGNECTGRAVATAAR